jgi:hypothetical protein
MRRRAENRPALVLLAICCCAHLFVVAASSQQPSPIPIGDDLNALLKRMETNNRANNRVAARYTFDWTSSCEIYNPKGKLLSDNSDKWVSVTIDGVQYERIVESNGKPLSKRKQIAERKRSDAVGELGKGYDFVFDIVRRDPRNNVYSDLPFSYLDSLFDNRVLGHQSINGRDTLVVESTPMVDAKPQSDREKTAFDWRETTWIDIEDLVPARYDLELVNRKNFLQKGTVYSVEFTRLPVTQTGNSQLPPNVWLIHSDSGHFIFWPANSEVLHDDFYNYKRFQSDSRVLEDSVQVGPSPGKQP